MGYGNDIAVRFNFQKIAPLGIGDADYHRIALALDMDESYVQTLCEGYAAKNRETAAQLGLQIPKAKHEERICYIGDSLTSDPTSHFRIAQAAFAGDENVKFMDFAISGWKTTDVLFEFDAAVIPFKPTIIHILLGANDSRNAYPGQDDSATCREGYRRNMDRLLELSLATGAKVILTTLMPCKEAADALPNGNKPVWEIAAFNDILRDLAKKHPVVFNDMEAEMRAKLDDIIDGFDNLHLNGYAHQLIAGRVIPHISEIIAGS